VSLPSAPNILLIGLLGGGSSDEVPSNARNFSNLSVMVVLSSDQRFLVGSCLRGFGRLYWGE